MRKQISKLIVIFGLSFLLVNAVGYIFNVTSLITSLNNPSGFGGRSVSNIPTILSVILTIGVYLFERFLKRRNI